MRSSSISSTELSKKASVLQPGGLAILSRQRSRVRAPSSPPYIPRGLFGIGGINRGAKGPQKCVLFAPPIFIGPVYKVAGFPGIQNYAGDCDSAWGEKTSDMTAAWAACFAGVIAWVKTSSVDRSEECRKSSCITLNSVPTFLKRVEYVCRKVCHPNFFSESGEHCFAAAVTFVLASYAALVDR